MREIADAYYEIKKKKKKKKIFAFIVFFLKRTVHIYIYTFTVYTVYRIHLYFLF
jgi:hypothetical protein